ncbi:acetamidase/formamidase family protein [Granulicella sp. dw_53]|uniref:acetamidase/formamidase family protein n=1 Tax=Granulicella sp. dw_53 TaxID=2719792 RepID=UPI001BD53A8B|nr:acetamidase/formamidase family protein [Granulicella sp. dw_53]
MMLRLALVLGLTAWAGAQVPVLQPLTNVAGKAPAGLGTGAGFYVPVTPETIRWGYLPEADAKPVLRVPSGSVVTFDTLSHEGLLEDQGRDAKRYFTGLGVPAGEVLRDAEAITGSGLAHDFLKDGPHIVMGPVEVQGAAPGDLLKIEFLAFTPRVPYGVVSNRHGKGALPGEFPESPEAGAGAGAASPEAFHNVSKLVRLKTQGGKLVGVMETGKGGTVEFPVAPFLGTVGVTPAGDGRTNSIPPGSFGGNIDIHYLVAGSTLYLPVQVAGAKLFVSDPHFAQGNGEVALTAVEGSVRATMRLTVLKVGEAGYPTKRALTGPFAETPEYWIPIGLDVDLNEAMKKAVRSAIDYLAENQGMDRAAAMAYLSAATDFEVSQVVDRVKGVHGLIRKRDFVGRGAK